MTRWANLFQFRFKESFPSKGLGKITFGSHFQHFISNQFRSNKTDSTKWKLRIQFKMKRKNLKLRSKTWWKFTHWSCKNEIRILLNLVFEFPSLFGATLSNKEVNLVADAKQEIKNHFFVSAEIDVMCVCVCMWVGEFLCVLQFCTYL